MRAGLAALGVALSLLAGCAVPLPGWPPDGPTGPRGNPGTTAAGFPCPGQESAVAASPVARPDGRVGVGRVSYPALPAPFGPPRADDYVPWSTQRLGQHAEVEPSSETSMGWESFVGLARITTGDGAWGGQQGAEAVAQCSLSMTWRGIDYRPALTRDEEVELGGRTAWLRVTALSFNVPGVRNTSETQTVAIITVDAETYAMVAYVPGSTPQFAPLVEDALAGLRVDG